ncbi:MAG: zinc ribbon domain-containing protein [Candidatus Lokiarchaeota archaeon]|nr:zinc ribbon domain-containing protein [Candidatus Lokiarchaeota archaeon]
MEDRKWIVIIFLGGILMIIGSATGSAGFYGKLVELTILMASPEWHPLLLTILTGMEYIAYWGGYSVIVGIFLILLGLRRLGKIIISIATSFGLIGLIIFIIVWFITIAGISLDPSVQAILDQIYNFFTINSGAAFAGTVLAIVGKSGIKKTPKIEAKKVEDGLITSEPAQEVPEIDPHISNLKNKYCPNCGKILPIHANFCNECGTSFD